MDRVSSSTAFQAFPEVSATTHTQAAAEPVAPEPEVGFLEQGIFDFFTSLNEAELEKGEVPEDEPETAAGPAGSGAAAPKAGATPAQGVYVGSSHLFFCLLWQCDITHWIGNQRSKEVNRH